MFKQLWIMRMNTCHTEPQAIRLPGTERQLEVVDSFPVLHYTEPKKRGETGTLYGYNVVILKARDMVLEPSKAVT